VCLRPEDLTVRRREEAVPRDSARNRLEGFVTETVPLGAQYRVHVDCGAPLVALVTKQSLEELKLGPGSLVLVTFKASAVHVIPR